MLALHASRHFQGTGDNFGLLAAAANDGARSALLAEVQVGLQSYVDDKGLAFRIESNVVVARS
jgi:hypothetical protein